MQFVNRRVILLGLGHTNAEILRRWAKNPLPNADLACISNRENSTYSGMLPGVLAGQYQPSEMTIDLRALCKRAKAEFICDELSHVDLEGQGLKTQSGRELNYDVLSIGVGSVPDTQGLDFSENAVPIKPMQTFLDRLEKQLESARKRKDTEKIELSVVGGGVAGIEVAFCLWARMKSKANLPSFEISIVHAGKRLGAGLLESTVQKIEAELRARKIRVLLETKVQGFREGHMLLSSGEVLQTHVAIWATGAVAPPVLRAFHVPKDEKGFLLTDSSLRLTSGDNVFAVGDSGTIAENSTPKAGVYAVRHAPVLWQNIYNLLNSRPLVAYTPQANFLKLLNLGSGTAIGEYLGVSFKSQWAWLLKDYIDSRFIKRYK